MVFSLAQKGEAPKSFLKLNKRGSPVNAILAATFFSLRRHYELCFT